VSEPGSLVRLEAAERMLAEIASVEDAHRVIDLAEAARVYARQSKLGTSAVNHATVIKLRAERRLADCVDEGQRQGQIAQAKDGRPQSARTPSTSAPATLKEIGVDSGRLSEARLLRDHYSDGEIVERATTADSRDRLLSRHELLTSARKDARRKEWETVREPDLPGGPYTILYADPPWRYEHVATSSRAVENQYPTMTLDEICALPVAGMAEPESALFLWATSPKLTEALAVMKAWGFTYRTNFVWVKDRIGMGYWARAQHELLLVGRRGEFAPPPEHARQPSLIEGARGAAFFETRVRVWDA